MRRKRKASPEEESEGEESAGGTMLRPKASILPREALIPTANIILPAPNQFTHELTRREPFYYARAGPDAKPDGEFPLAAKVALLRYDGGAYCWVVDGQGLYVEVKYERLRKL